MVRTRFAPSPTGKPHIGHLRTAVYAYALAKHNQGQFIFRLEDTDQNRYSPESVADLKRVIKVFGINWDEYYVQSQRKSEGFYQKIALRLVTEGKAFFCQCPARDAKHQGYSQVLRDPCRDKNFTSGAIKLKIPGEGKIKFIDFVHNKEIGWDLDKVYDATLLKTDGFPTYHLAAMADDVDMKITHVLRGHDWLPSTPVHLLVYDYLGYRPEIGHLTDILAPEGGKLSKRKGSTSIDELLAQGYLPEALLNFVILLGWAPKDNRELYTLDEFVQEFDVGGFQESNPKFEDQKLKWFNGHYLRQKSDEELMNLINFSDKTKLKQILPLVKDRLVTLADFDQLTSFFFKAPEVSEELNTDHLQFAIDNYDKLVTGELIEAIKAKGWKVGDFFMTIRIAICGTRSTPPITETMLVLGKDESLKRLTAGQA